MDAHERTLLWHFVEHWAEQKPDAEAMVFEDTRMSWKQFRDEVDKAALALLALGVRRGDPVAMVSMGRPEFMITFMAASKIGAIWLGLSPKFSVDELRYLIGDSRPVVLITLKEYQGVDLVKAGITFLQEFPFIRQVLTIGGAAELGENYHEFVARPHEDQRAALAERAAEVRPEDEALLIYTSGSTGKPKGVLQTQQAIISNIAVETKYFEWDEQTRALLHFPINHVAADVEIGFGAVYAGATLILMDRFDPELSLEMVAKEKITALGQVPVMFLLQFQTPKFGSLDWSHVKAFIYGGTTPPQVMVATLGTLAERIGARLMTGYGSTELCGFVTYSMPGDDIELLTKSAGKIVPPFEMKVVDEERETLPHGEIGEIAVRGPSVMAGYLHNPAATAAVIDAEGWYYTSDLGYMNEAGYLFISGRKSEMYKSGGENIFPREIEEVLEAHPAVLFAAVIGVPDPTYSEVGHAFIMLKPGKEAAPEALRSHCKQHLANFKVPKKFELRPTLPLLPNGKVNKMVLRTQLGLV